MEGIKNAEMRLKCETVNFYILTSEVHKGTGIKKAGKNVEEDTASHQTGSSRTNSADLQTAMGRALVSTRNYLRDLLNYASDANTDLTISSNDLSITEQLDDDDISETKETMEPCEWIELEKIRKHNYMACLHNKIENRGAEDKRHKFPAGFDFNMCMWHPELLITKKTKRSLVKIFKKFKTLDTCIQNIYNYSKSMGELGLRTNQHNEHNILSRLAALLQL